MQNTVIESVCKRCCGNPFVKVAKKDRTECAFPQWVGQGGMASCHGFVQIPKKTRRAK